MLVCQENLSHIRGVNCIYSGLNGLKCCMNRESKKNNIRKLSIKIRFPNQLSYSCTKVQVVLSEQSIEYWMKGAKYAGLFFVHLESGCRCAQGLEPLLIQPSDYAVGHLLPVLFHHHVVGHAGEELSRAVVGAGGTRLLHPGENAVVLGAQHEDRSALHALGMWQVQ